MAFCTTPCIFGRVLLRTTLRRRSEDLSWESERGGSVFDFAEEGQVISSAGRISENVLGGGLVDKSTDKFRVVSNYQDIINDSSGLRGEGGIRMHLLLPGLPHMSFLPAESDTTFFADSDGGDDTGFITPYSARGSPWYMVPVLLSWNVYR
jgi:hypothetical protein